MSPLQLLPIPAAGSLISAAADKVADGLSFAETLLRGGEAATEDNAAGLTPTELHDRKSAADQAEQALADFGRLAQERLAEAGIDTTQPIELEFDGFGRVVAGGDHPDRAAIERVFASDTELGQAFRKATSAVGLLQSGAPLGDSPNLVNGLERLDIRLSLRGEAASVL